MADAPPEAYVEIGRTLDVAGRELEILRSLADCNGTRVYYRDRGKPPLHITPLSPPEIRGGWGAHGGDIIEALFEPVDPHREEIEVLFGLRRDQGVHVTIPIDRRRTAGLERYLTEPLPPPVQADGIEITVTAARVGVLSGVVDMTLTTRDESILTLEMGWPHRVHVWKGPGPKSFWDDWHPAESQVQEKTLNPDGTWTMSVSQKFSLTAVARRGAPPRPRLPEPPRPPEPVRVVAAPGGEPLGGTGSTMARGRPPRPPVAYADVHHDPPPREASGVEILLTGLYLCRFGSDRIVTVPNPTPDTITDLNGTDFDIPDGRVDLLRWEPGYDVLPNLVVRTPSTWWWPDIRIFHEEQSVSLWMYPGLDGTVVGGLPRMYEAAFRNSSGVRLALRMLGRPTPEVRLPVALTAPGS